MLKNIYTSARVLDIRGSSESFELEYRQNNKTFRHMSKILLVLKYSMILNSITFQQITELSENCLMEEVKPKVMILNMGGSRNFINFWQFLLIKIPKRRPRYFVLLLNLPP